MHVPSDPLVRFQQIYGELDLRRSWTQGVIPLRYAATALMTTDGPAYQIADRVYTMAGKLAQRAGWFGPLNSPVRFVVAAVLARDHDDVGRFCAEVERTGALFAEHGLRRGTIYAVIATLILRDGQPPRRVEPRDVERFARIYAAFRQHHWWLTGPDDYPACALLTRGEAAVPEIERRVEYFYRGLRAEGLPAGNALQLATHILQMSPAAEGDVLRQFTALHRAFRAAGIAMWQTDFDEVAELTLVDRPTAQVVERVVEHRAVLRALRPAPDAVHSFSLACATAFLSLLGDTTRHRPLLDATAILQVQAAVAAQQAAAASAAAAS